MRFLGVEGVIDQPIYDTIRVPVVAGAQTVSFFRIAQGGLLAAGIPKTYSMTNVLQVGRIDRGYQLKINAMSLCVRHQLMVTGTVRSWADYRAIYNLSFIQLFFNDRPFGDYPTHLIPAGNEEDDYFSNIAPAATEFNPMHGISSVNNKFPLATPLTLEEEETFRVDLNIGSAIAALTDVTFTYWGELTTPVR